jgi:AcrR family transcriptional regulator
MPREHSGTGDPTSSLVLLWRPPAEPSPARRLGADRIIRSAVELADAHGLGAVSMRRVADDLGVGTMSLYTYVPGKAELLDAMLDLVVAETARPERVDGGWRARLALIARENLALLRRHPWILEVDAGRPSLGPNMLAKYDYELRAVEGIGLSDLEMDAVVTLVLSHAAGAARATADGAGAQAETGVTPRVGWNATEPVLRRFSDPERFPRAVRVAVAVARAHEGAHDPDHAFAFGLERLLDGIDVLLRERG